MGSDDGDRHHVEAIKTDIRNLLTRYMQGTPDRLPQGEALAEAIALQQLSQEIFKALPRLHPADRL